MRFFAFSVGLFAGLAHAGGINCKGSFHCGDSGSPRLWFMIQKLSGKLDSEHWYQNGQHIGCFHYVDVDKSAMCVFLQGTGGMPGKAIVPLLQSLSDHGCAQCGSIPVFYPDNNNEGDHGILTVNYVHDANDCYDVCTT